MVSEKSEAATADKTFEELLSHNPASPDPALNGLVKKVGGRLAMAANRSDYHWEFLVLENNLGQLYPYIKAACDCHAEVSFLPPRVIGEIHDPEAILKRIREVLA